MNKLYDTKLKRALLVSVYAVFYFVSFLLLEQRNVNVHIISTSVDAYIPFCEWFIIPYLLWFVYMGACVVWFVFGPSTTEEFRRFALYLGTGMTAFIVISWLWPNGLQLRPSVYPRDNILTSVVKLLYKADTSTNVFPSIHVFNSIAMCVAVWDCSSLKKKSALRWGTLVLTVLIVLSTLFLKQHSVIDATGGLVLAILLQQAFYPDLQRRRQYQQQHVKVHS